MSPKRSSLGKTIYTSPGGHKLTKEKAKEILSDGSVRGHPLTKKQKGYFGAVAGGKNKK